MHNSKKCDSKENLLHRKIHNLTVAAKHISETRDRNFNVNIEENNKKKKLRYCEYDTALAHRLLFALMLNNSECYMKKA